MRLRNIISDIAIYVNNEEHALLDKLPNYPIDRMAISEREQIVVDHLIRKSLVKKILKNDKILVQKNIAEKS